MTATADSSTNGMTSTEEKIVAALEPRAEQMLLDLGRYVAIPTGGNHQPGLDEYRGLLIDRLSKIGGEAEIVPGKPKPAWLMGGGDGAVPPCAVITSPAMRAKPCPGTKVLIACHLDTVFDPEDDFREMTVAADGKTATGPGVVDMKGGTLTTINALEILHELGAEVPWTLVLTSDEETGSYCSDHVLTEQSQRHDIGLATEPALPGGELVVERLGSGQFRIKATGRSAHVGRNFTGGVSAVTALAETLTEVAKLPDPERGRILSVGPLVGGAATNAVPDVAYAWGNARYPDATIADETAALLGSLERDADLDRGVAGITIDRCFQRPAKPRTDGTMKVALIARAAAEALGQSLPFAATGGVCDGNILQAAGLPTIDTMGVRGGGLHTTDEWIEVRSLVERAQLMAVFLSRVGEHGLGAPSAAE